MVASDKGAKGTDADPFSHDGRFADFISIGVDSDGDSMETIVLKDSNAKECDSDLSDMQSDELDVLIKPIRIMNKTSLPNASVNC